MLTPDDRREIDEQIVAKLDAESIVSIFTSMDERQKEELAQSLSRFMVDRAQALRKPENYYTPQWRKQDQDINYTSPTEFYQANVAGHAGPTLPRALNLQGANWEAWLSANNPEELNLRVRGGGGADCMFDYLVSSCWAAEITAGRGVQGQTFPSLTGCTFTVYSTVRAMMAVFLADATATGSIRRICYICNDDADTNIEIGGDSNVGNSSLLIEGFSGIRSGVAANGDSTALRFTSLIANDAYFKSSLAFTPYLYFRGLHITGGDSSRAGAFFYNSNAAYITSGIEFDRCHIDMTVAGDQNPLIRTDSLGDDGGPEVLFRDCWGSASALVRSAVPGFFTNPSVKTLQVIDSTLTLTRLATNNSVQKVILRGGELTFTTTGFNPVNASNSRDNNLLRISDIIINYSGTGTCFSRASAHTNAGRVFLSGIEYYQTNAAGKAFDISGSASATETLFADGVFMHSTPDPSTGPAFTVGSNMDVAHVGDVACFQFTTCISGATPVAAPSDAQYLTLATSTGLSAERVFTPRYNLYATDAGANGAYTVDSWLEGATITPSGTVLTLGTDGDVFHVGAGDFATIATPTRQTLALLVFDGVSVLTHGANLILQGAVNFTSAAGDALLMAWEGGTVWREVNRHTAAAAITAEHHTLMAIVDNTVVSTTVPYAVIGPLAAAATVTAVEAIAGSNVTCGATSMIVDVHKVLSASKNTDGQGTTLFTTQGNRPTISSGNKLSTITLPDVTALAAGDLLMVYVDQGGSSLLDVTVAVRVTMP